MFRLTLLFSALALCTSFAPLASQRVATTTRLASSVTSNHHDNYWEKQQQHDDLYFRQIISKARECAYNDDDDDNTAAKKARFFLHEILHLESSCVSGTLSGDICDNNNVDQVADIVAHLRVKAAVQSEAPEMALTIMSDMALTLLSTTVIFIMVAALVMTMNLSGSDATPFAHQEWGLSFQGGFVDKMLEHYLRNGGL